MIIKKPDKLTRSIKLNWPMDLRDRKSTIRMLINKARLRLLLIEIPDNAIYLNMFQNKR